MDAAQGALEEHLRSGRLLSGVARGRWSVVELSWPFVYVGVAARDGRHFTLQFECSGYPYVAPTATLWDREGGHQLAAQRWPRGGRVAQMFNPGWKGGAIYIPCDRQSIEGHPHWHGEFPWLIWNPARGLTQYLEGVSETLQSHELLPEAA